MLRSQMPVILLGAWTSSSVSGAGPATVVVGAVVVVGLGRGDVVAVVVVSKVVDVGVGVVSGSGVATGVASSARQP